MLTPVEFDGQPTAAQSAAANPAAPLVVRPGAHSMQEAPSAAEYASAAQGPHAHTTCVCMCARARVCVRVRVRVRVFLAVHAPCMRACTACT